jgi:hypothetical protein
MPPAHGRYDHYRSRLFVIHAGSLGVVDDPMDLASAMTGSRPRPGPFEQAAKSGCMRAALLQNRATDSFLTRHATRRTSAGARRIWTGIVGGTWQQIRKLLDGVRPPCQGGREIPARRTA